MSVLFIYRTFRGHFTNVQDMLSNVHEVPITMLDTVSVEL